MTPMARLGPHDDNRQGSLRSQVYLRLQEDILDGRYQPGAALTELRVSTELGVSRTPVREAFRQLELDGLVVSTPNKGIVVQGIDEQDIEDMFEIRVHVEGIAARRAARTMDEQERRELAEALALEEFYTIRNDVEALQTSDSRFHEIIFKGSHSRVLQNLLRTMHSHTRSARRRSLSSAGRPDEALAEHRRIMGAILAGQPEQAEALMIVHIRNAVGSYEKALSSRR
jgi:DNA-binding GntR family transcriptional regulator